MTEHADASNGLKRQIGLLTATALVVGEVVGVGIFLTPAKMTKSVGSPFFVLVVCLVPGRTALFRAVSFGELAPRRPEQGGQYGNLRDPYRHPLAILHG